jgi:hypothetical protein
MCVGSRRDWSPQVQVIAAENGHDAVPIDDPVYETTAITDGTTVQQLLSRALEMGSTPKQKL